MNQEQIVVARDRRRTNCAKWDGLKGKFGEEDLLAMWVADMDFESPACVKDALRRMVEEGIYGYYITPKAYYQSFIDWEKQYFGYEVDKKWLRYTPGVVSGIHMFLQVLTKPQDSVIVFTPVYYPFLDSVRNTGRKLICCDLKEENGVYSIDYDKVNKELRENRCRLLILSSPHNPVGKVWTKEELKPVLDLCKELGVYVISDEIHQDIVIGEKKQTPTALMGPYDDILVTLTAASKTFNLAGCVISFAIVPSEEIRKRFDEFIKGIQVDHASNFSYAAVTAAYEQGRSWLEAVLDIIRGNYRYMKETLEKNLPDIVVSPLEGTYLLWVNFGAYYQGAKLEDFLQNQCRLAVDYGHWFGGERFDGYARFNLATSFENVKQAADRIVTCCQKD